MTAVPQLLIARVLQVLVPASSTSQAPANAAGSVSANRAAATPDLDQQLRREDLHRHIEAEIQHHNVDHHRRGDQCSNTGGSAEEKQQSAGDFAKTAEGLLDARIAQRRPK